MSRTQDCSRAHCRKPSLPGFYRGNGLCRFHWAEAVWGRAWAERCRADEKLVELKEEEQEDESA